MAQFQGVPRLNRNSQSARGPPTQCKSSLGKNMISFRPYQSGASISWNLWGGSNSVTRTFFSGILRTLLALFVHCRFCLKCLYVAIAHLMQFCFFSVLCHLGNWTFSILEKEKKTHCDQKWVDENKRVSWEIQPSEIFFEVFFKCDLFHAKLLERFLDPNSNVTTSKTLKIVPPSLSILL